VTDPKVVVKTAKATMPGKLGLRCPEGSFPLHTDVYGASSTVIEQGKGGSRIKPGSLDEGRVAMQLTCRKGGNVANFPRVSFGTKSADKMATRKKGGVLFGGPGKDRLNVKRKNGTAFGGNGSDRIVAGAASGVAVGGPGSDVIRSRTAGRTLLIGGTGHDRIVAGGKARVNVRDGERDQVTCRGKSVRVKVDRFDHLSRNCSRA
jgi:Ca2+-binding RTX toxin-like protein